MGAILDLLKDIPLSAVIKERLAQAEAKITTLDRENSVMKAQIDVLQTENRNLKAKLNQPDAQKPGDPCPYCRRQTGELQRMEPHPVLDLHGINNGYYKCSACGKTYEKQINMIH